MPWSAKVWRYCVPPHALRVWGETTFRRLFPNTLIDRPRALVGRGTALHEPALRPRDRPWVEKARREGERGALVVGLLPARTDTAWFHEHVYRAATRNPIFKGTLEV